MLQLQFNRSIFHNAHIRRLLTTIRIFTTKVTRYIRKHPFQTTFILLSFFRFPVIPVMLSAIGFSSIGPVAGSLAAAWQSLIGTVAAGTPFALLQSAAMGGAVAGLSYGVGGVGLGTVAGMTVLGGVMGWWKGRREREMVEQGKRWQDLDG